MIVSPEPEVLISVQENEEKFHSNVDFVPTHEATERYKRLGLNSTILLARSMGLEEQVGELAGQVEVLEQEKLQDPLTGLHNNKSFELALERAVECEKESGRVDGEESNIVVIEMDLIRFKAINDELGHAAGDEVLQEVAGWLRAAVRQTDMPSSERQESEAPEENAPEIGEPGHPHGDEYRVFIADITANTDIDMPNEVRVQRVIERLREAIMLGMKTSKYAEVLERLSAGISLGAAIYRHGETLKEFVDRADANQMADKDKYYEAHPEIVRRK